MRGGFSAPRRPRSAFKESSQEDAVSLRAPRERSRKEKPVLGSSASSSSRSRNNKKKRSALSEVQFLGSDHDQEEDGYETMEQLSPSPSRGSPVFSDEDDEHPQVRRRRESSSSAPKLKLPQKVPENNIISAGLGLIPRKVRSAYVKRAHEGTSSAPPIPDATATALHCFSGAKVPSPSNCNGRIRSVSPSPSAAKSAKRMKPIGTKPRPAKFLKVSAAFSEQEVEVAEVLFGFASQITTAEENLNDLKAASSSSPSLPPNVSSPMRVSSPISASPSRLAQPTEGPKKKRPRPTKIDEIGSPAAPATALAYCQSTGVEIGSSDNADGIGGFTNEITNVLPPTTSATQNHTTSSSFGQRYGELTRETVTVSEKISVKFEDSDVVAPLPEAAKTADIPVKVEGVSESERNQIEAEKIDRQTDALPSENSIGKFESPVLSPSIVDAKTTSLEKMEIDLMVPPEKEANISEIDSTIVAADRATTELPAEGTMGVSSAFEGKSISVDKVRDQEKREDSAEYKEGEKSSCKGDLIEESVVERHIKVENIKEESQVDSMRGNDNDSSKLLPQKQERITNTDSRMQKQEKPDVPSLAVSASCAVSCSTNGAAGPSPISMAVAGWPGALSALGRYFGPAAATWPGPSLPGMMPVEGNLMKGIQRWQMLKRSATHAYIAHFIDYQQQMARNPFWTAAYGNPTALYGGKPYNMNIPFAPATEPILGSSLPGSDPFLSARNSNIMGSSFNESNIATAALAAISGHNLKEKATSSYMDVLRKPQQQEVQPTSSVTIQPNLPNFGFPVTESGASTSAVAVNTGNACPLVNGKNSGTGPPLPAGASTNLTGGTGAANSSLASMASAQAQYLAMFPQTGFHFPLPPMHFGATNSGTHNHHEHPQIFNGSFYAAHLLHPPSHPQQQGQQNQSNTGSSSQKHQQQFNFSSPQHQTPSSSQQHHLFSSSQTSQAESGYTNGVDAASTADRKLPLGQKNLYSQDSPINSNNNANSVSLLAPNSTGHSQDFTLMTAFGGKNNVKQQQMQVSMQSHGFDPSMEMSLKGQQCNQSTKQAVGRVKGMAQSTPSNYGDHITGASNLSKSQEASISGQSHKQHDQHLPEWKVSSAMPTSAGTSHQAVVAGPIRNSSQQVRHQQVSSNLLANLAGGAIPQAVFTTSTKNYGQQSRNQHSNSSPAAMSKSKTTGIPTSKTLTGGKATASLPQRSIAPTSGKRSSPNHMSPSLSGNKPLQQQQQQPQQTTQSATTIGPGQVTGSKNQQYYTQPHFNPQQSYSQQIHQQLLFQQKHYLQQPVQQSQLSSQPAQHAVVHQQHLQIPGLNYSQPSLSNRHPQQDQRQQILPASVTPSDQVPGSTLSSGLPSLSLGRTSSGRSPAKILPAGLVKANHTGTTVLHEQYNSLNDMASTQKQSDSPRPTLSPHRAQAASVLQKSPEQKSESDGLHQDEVNGVHFVDLNICAQARTNVSTSSVQTSSIQKTTGNLKMVQGGNNEESMSGQGGTNLSGVPSGHTYQDLGSASSEQTPPMPFQQTPVSRASGPISSVINSPHEAVASIAHL